MGDMGGAQARGWGSCQVLAAVLSLSPRLLGAAPAECGKPAVTGKIFGGENAPELRWPWQVSLLYQNRHVCGAALIDAFWVLSAAHCFQLSHTPDDYKVLLGYHKLQQPSKHSLVRTLHHVIVHPDFNKTHFLANDIALLQLRVPVNFSLHVLPACLQKPNETLQTGKTCWVTGWGMITEAEFLPKPQQLQQAEIGILESRICQIFYQRPGRFPKIQDDVLCGGDLNTGKAICAGDSGGPLVCETQDVWYLVGLSSWSMDCHYPIGPSIFTKLTYFSHWISENQKNTAVPPQENAPPQGPPPVLIDFTVTTGGNRPQPCTALLSSQVLLWLLGLPLDAVTCL